MKATTVRQPRAFAIAYGGMRILPKTWRTTYRGRIGLQAGLKWDHDAEQEPRIRVLAGWHRDTLPTGAVVAVATLVGCHRVGHCWGWEFADVTPLAVPVACTGGQQLWELPDEVAAEVAAQLGVAA